MARTTWDSWNGRQHHKITWVLANAIQTKAVYMSWGTVVVQCGRACNLVGASTSLSSRTRVAEALLMSRKAWYASSGAPGVRTAVSPVQPAQIWRSLYKHL